MSLVEPPLADQEPPRVKMTLDEFLRLPDDGVDRMLIDGEVWELGMTLRAHLHGETVGNIAVCLGNWSRTQPRPRGKMSVGDVGFRLMPDDSMVGPDVAYASAELMAQTPRATAYLEGPPVLAVEVLSRSDTQDAIITKVYKCLEAGVVVWEVDPEFQTVRVHRPGLGVELYKASDELVGDPYLPGFRVAVAEFFAD